MTILSSCIARGGPVGIWMIARNMQFVYNLLVSLYVLLSIFNHCDIIGQQSNRIRWKTQKKGYYAVHGHSRSSKSVYQSKAFMRLMWLTVTEILSRNVSEISQCIVQILDTLRFWFPFGGLRTTYYVYISLIGKRIVDFLLALIELFSLGITAEALYGRK